MRRLLLVALLAVAVAAISLVGSGAGGDTGHYLVNAEFRNAFSVIPGEDVKIAGVKVGRIKSLGVTPRQTALVTLDITKPGFGDWRSDAECIIRPQSLIGEKFVECTPTKPRPVGAQAPPLLRTRTYDGQTVAILPVDRTRRAVDIDLVQNTLRLPYRERFTILLNEFGAGLAGRGADLNKIIRTADPSLKATDDVLTIVARQNRVLERLAVDSDRALAPIARDRKQVTGFITKAAEVSEATASQSTALQANIARFPAFLRELELTMNRLGGLSDQGAPLLADLNTVGPSLTRVVEQLGPFSEASTPALTSLGETSVTGRRALVASKPVVGDLKTLGRVSRPLAANLGKLTSSLKRTGGIEELLDFIFHQVTAVNGYDQFGHYLRAQLLVNLCSDYATENDPTCTANFIAPEGGERSVRSAPSPATTPVSAASTAATTKAAAASAAASASQSEATNASLLDYLMGSGG